MVCNVNTIACIAFSECREEFAYEIVIKFKYRLCISSFANNHLIPPDLREKVRHRLTAFRADQFRFAWRHSAHAPSADGAEMVEEEAFAENDLPDYLN